MASLPPTPWVCLACRKECYGGVFCVHCASPKGGAAHSVEDDADPGLTAADENTGKRRRKEGDEDPDGDRSRMGRSRVCVVVFVARLPTRLHVCADTRCQPVSIGAAATCAAAVQITPSFPAASPFFFTHARG